MHEVDTIALGTGFAATELLLPMQVTGRDGRHLSEQWGQGAQAHLGTTVAGSPSLFLLYGPNTNLGHNSIILMLESQIAYVADAVRHLREAGLAPRSETAGDERVQRPAAASAAGTVFTSGCRSWYLTASGRNTQNWPGTAVDFRRRTRRARLEDFDVVRARATTPT